MHGFVGCLESVLAPDRCNTRDALGGMWPGDRDGAASPGDGDRQRHARQLLRRRPHRDASRPPSRTRCGWWSRERDLLDIGGESSRPGAEPVPLDEELRRVIPVVEALAPRVARPDLGRHDQGRGRPPGALRRAPRSSTTSRRLGGDPDAGPGRRRGRRGGRADAHGGDAADHAGRPAVRRRRRARSATSWPAASTRSRRWASPARGSRSTRGSGSARRSSTTWSSCGTSIDLPPWDVRSWSAPRARGSWARSPAGRSPSARRPRSSRRWRPPRGGAGRPGPRRRADGRRHQGLDRAPRLG